MAKPRVSYVCRSCGGVQSRWAGKCPDCGVWDTLEEHRVDASVGKDPQRGLAASWAGFIGGSAAERVEGVSATATPRAMPIDAIERDGASVARLETGIGELDRVLGGGIVPGSAVLIGGDPGIGKSTLMLQAAAALSEAGVRTLYVSSEESVEQVAMRAMRLAGEGAESSGRRRGRKKAGAGEEGDGGETGGTPVPLDGVGGGGECELWALADTNLARIVEQARVVSPRVLVIDSVQMIYKADLEASPGSIAQLRRCCTELVYLAKVSGMAVVLVGHVTKEGALAGPRLLEHLVDVVLSFEGDHHHVHRVIRAVKNRFGATDELGLFEMSDRGLREVVDGAGVSAQRDGPARPGSVVCPAMSGSRCFLVEVQALTATGFLGAAKRKSSGVDASRLAMLIAVLEQHAGLRLADRDVFASAVGGVRVVEPAADLALALAIAGSHARRALGPATCAVGEVGLGGEVRPVNRMEQRVREAARLGYTRVLCAPMRRRVAAPGIEVDEVATIGAALERLG